MKYLDPKRIGYGVNKSRQGWGTYISCLETLSGLYRLDFDVILYGNLYFFQSIILNDSQGRPCIVLKFSISKNNMAEYCKSIVEVIKVEINY